MTETEYDSMEINKQNMTEEGEQIVRKNILNNNKRTELDIGKRCAEKWKARRR